MSRKSSACSRMASNGEDRYLDTDTPGVDILYGIQQGVYTGSVLKAASSLNIFDLLEEHGDPYISVQELCTVTGYQTSYTERLLNTLTAMKLIQRRGNLEAGYQYKNSEAGKLLGTTRADTLKEMVTWMSFFNDAVKNLPDVIKKGSSAVQSCGGEVWDPASTSDQITEDNIKEDRKTNTNIKGMQECKHGNYHDNSDNVYDEHGSHLHGPGNHSNKDTDHEFSGSEDKHERKDKKSMEECKHGNFHDKSGNVYDAAGNHIHGSGGHDETMPESSEVNMEAWDEYGLYQGMHNLLGSSSAKLMTAIDLSEHKSAVDLGGGSGILCFELKRQYPAMDVTLFELDGIVKLFKERFLPGNEHLGVKTIAGDWNKMDLPKADLYIVSQIIHEIKNPMDFLRKIYSAINLGGTLMLLDYAQADDKVSLAPVAVWDVVMMCYGGIMRSPQEFRKLLTDVGFTDVTVVRTQAYNEYDIIYSKKPEHSDKKILKK